MKKSRRSPPLPARSWDCRRSCWHSHSASPQNGINPNGPWSAKRLWRFELPGIGRTFSPRPIGAKLPTCCETTSLDPLGLVQHFFDLFWVYGTGFGECQVRLWEMAVANARRDMNSDVAALYIDSLNKVNEMH